MKAEAICYLLLAHQNPSQIRELLERWRFLAPSPSEVLLGYGGSRENFSRIDYEPKIFLDDPRLRTRDHQREKQSYSQVFQQAGAWLQGQSSFPYVYLAEYDHWPLVADLGQRLIERLKRDHADMLGHQLARRDRTSCVYYLYHLSDERFLPWLRRTSIRSDQEAVFNMFGSGSFWTREAFLAVAKAGEPFPMYLETYLPTLAHHLGFRIRDFEEQNRFISALGDRYGEIEEARKQGAWTLHPVKTWPSPPVGSPE